MKGWGTVFMLAVAIVVAGCGSTTGNTSPTGRPAPAGSPTSAGSSQTASPSAPASTVLFAILEARHCTAPEPGACEGNMTWRHDTVAIAGSDGFAKAKTTFSPRSIPPVGNAATVLDLEGQVAAGAVYFVDGAGTVRRMTPDGTTTRVASFPINSNQQSISFAVSPDGKSVIAAVLTYPVNTPQSNASQPPWGTFSGPWKLQIEKATAGGSASVLHEWQTGTSQYPNGPGGFPNIWLAGWDAHGPIAVVGQNTGTQNAWFSNQHYFAGSMTRLNADGTPGSTIGPANCLPYWRPTAGLFVCTPTNATPTSTVDVVDLSGNVVWSGHVPTSQYESTGDFSVCPDGTRLAIDNELINLKDNSSVQLASSFQPQGWLDNQTLIGWLPQNGPTAPHVGVLHLSDPQHPEDWGFTGAFVGLIA